MFDGCILCGLTIPSALTNAHAHEGTEGWPERVFRLCWTCHRMYDHDIVETGELIKAETAWAAGNCPDATQLHRKLEADLAAGDRVVDKARQHKGAAVRAGLTRRLSLRAQKAWLTRKARS
jgi:hypothetical protein